MERWPSGRWQLTANQLVRVTGPGGSNPPLSAIDFKTAFDGTKLSVICGNGIRSELPPKKQLITVFLEKSGILKDITVGIRRTSLMVRHLT